MRRHSVSAGAVVIRNDQRFLAVQRRDTGAWVTPGGVVEPGEPLHDAATREVYEETGITIELDTLTGIYHNLSTDVVTFVFRARPTNTQHPHTTDETTHIQWLTPTEAANLMTNPFTTRVHDAFTNQPPIIRTLTEQHIMAPKTTLSRSWPTR